MGQANSSGISIGVAGGVDDVLVLLSEVDFDSDEVIVVGGDCMCCCHSSRRSMKGILCLLEILVRKEMTDWSIISDIEECKDMMISKQQKSKSHAKVDRPSSSVNIF